MKLSGEKAEYFLLFEFGGKKRKKKGCSEVRCRKEPKAIPQGGKT